jgi:uncharacterized protein (DUF169 family)
MDMSFKDKFSTLFERYFDGSELPIVFYYTNERRNMELVEPQSVRCIMEALSDVRKGRSLLFSQDSITCKGGKRFLGFSQEMRPDFEHFLSSVEHYKKSPELVREMIKSSSGFKAPADFIAFKRWDKLEETDEPEVVIFFSTVDVLSGLFTLANYDVAEPDGVFTPMGAGCSSIILRPYLEKESKHPRGVIGMFDIAARPFVAENTLTFSAPMRKFAAMVENMESSFLTTKSWKKVLDRISMSAGGKEREGE